MVALAQIPVHLSIHEFLAWNPGDGRINMRVPGFAASWWTSTGTPGCAACLWLDTARDRPRI